MTPKYYEQKKELPTTSAVSYGELRFHRTLLRRRTYFDAKAQRAQSFAK